MIYITGDTHRTDLLYIHIFCDNHPELTKNDYIIIAGDFGGVWAKDTLERDLKPFSDLPVTVLFVDGNHENFDLLNAYPVEMWKGGKVHKIKPDIIHLMRGQVFEIEGKTIFTFGGAARIDRDWRIEGESWRAQELPTYEELDEGIANLKRYGNKVDYIITHFRQNARSRFNRRAKGRSFKMAARNRRRDRGVRNNRRLPLRLERTFGILCQNRAQFPFGNRKGPR